MADTRKNTGSAFTFTGEDYVRTFNGAFEPQESKTQLEQVMVRTSNQGNPQIGVMVRLIKWTDEELAINAGRKNRYANGNGRTAWAWIAFGPNQSEDFLRVTSEHISEVLGTTVSFNKALTLGDVGRLVKQLENMVKAGPVVGSIWLVSPDNGRSLTFWKTQADAIAFGSNAS